MGRPLLSPLTHGLRQRRARNVTRKATRAHLADSGKRSDLPRITYPPLPPPQNSSASPSSAGREGGRRRGSASGSLPVNVCGGRFIARVAHLVDR